MKGDREVVGGSEDDGREGAAVRIGVTGHRPNRLVVADLASLRARIAAVLDAIRDGGGGGENVPIPRRLTVVSSLAEGADRLVAVAALARGDALRAVLPFPRAEFARDFASDASRAEYAALLDRAGDVIELPGARGRTATGAAYAASGDAVLAQSDLLLAVWDGEDGRGIGGTAHTVEVALEQGVPVVWIAARPPHLVRVLTAGPDGSTVESDLASLLIWLARDRVV